MRYKYDYRGNNQKNQDRIPTYIIAEVGSNFDGDLERAKKLALLAKEVGADAYKIQNFLAPKIVSQRGFENLQTSFQAKWDKPVVDVYKSAEFPREWLRELSDYCKEIGIDFMSAPYDSDAVDLLEKIDMPVYKVGSGEIDNHFLLKRIAQTGKPMLVACGSSTMEEIGQAVDVIRREGNKQITILQCVTNYPSPIADSNLRAMVEIGKSFGVAVGYSDHTIGIDGGGDDPLGGMTVPLGAVALGAVVIEKHFTDDRTRKGPDHPFAMEAGKFRSMVEGIRALESALGNGRKEVMSSEVDTVIIQRRGMYAARKIPKGEPFIVDAVKFLRPAIGLRPSEMERITGKVAVRDIEPEEPIKEEMFS